MRNDSLWGNLVFEKEIISHFFRHLKAHKFVQQWCFVFESKHFIKIIDEWTYKLTTKKWFAYKKNDTTVDLSNPLFKNEMWLNLYKIIWSIAFGSRRKKTFIIYHIKFDCTFALKIPPITHVPDSTMSNNFSQIY